MNQKKSDLLVNQSSNLVIQSIGHVRTRNKAFTLIELLVVIVIIGILATIGVAQFNGYQERARMARGIAFASQAKKILNLSLEKTVGFWDFNEGAGTFAIDKSGRENDFPLNGGTSMDQSFDPGGQSSLKLSNSNIYLEPKKTNFDNTAFTVSSWMKLDVNNISNSDIIAVSPFDYATLYGSQRYTPSIGYWTDGSQLGIRRVRWSTMPFNVVDGKWYHHLLTMRQTGNELCEFKTYLDGVLVDHTKDYYCPNDPIDVDRISVGNNLEIDDLGVWNVWYD